MTLYGKLLLILDSETAVSEWSEAADFVLVYKNNRVKIVYKKRKPPYLRWFVCDWRRWRDLNSRYGFAVLPHFEFYTQVSV